MDRVSVIPKKLNSRPWYHNKPWSTKNVTTTDIKSINAANHAHIETLPTLTDTVTNINYLIDTGAVTSLIPCQQGDKKHKDDKLTLTAANGDIVHTYGSKLVNLHFGKFYEIDWVFTVADIKQPILGMDFIKTNNLILHPRDNSVTLYDTGERVQLTTSSKPKTLPVQHLRDTIPADVEAMLNKYPNLTSNTEKLSKPKHKFAHKITVSGDPITDRPRRFSPEKQKELDRVLERMVNEGILIKGNSQWLSHPHLVRKKNGDYRATVDFRRLNERIKPDNFPLPLLRSFCDDMQGATMFSALDIKDAFYNIPITDDSQDYTAFVTHNDIYKFLRLPMGLKSSPTVFQKIFSQIMDNIRTRSGRKVKLFIYIDDILIPSKNRQEAIEDLQAVLQRLNENGFRISKDKCRFLLPKLEFLGYTVTADGILPTPDKVETIKTFPRPDRLKQLRRYLGMLNFYHNFCENLAKITAPLSQLLSGPQPAHKANPKIKWTEESITAFEKSKEVLSDKTLLVYRDPTAETAIFSDASAKAIGAVLQQRINNTWQPLGFFSRKLSITEQKYSTFGRELLGIYAAVKHFRTQIEGREFYIMTDHKPLTYCMSKKGIRELNREERQLQYISSFTTKIQHVSGADNVVADALSRRLEEYVSQDEDDIESDDEISRTELPGSNDRRPIRQHTSKKENEHRKPHDSVVTAASEQPRNMKENNRDHLNNCPISAMTHASLNKELNTTMPDIELKKLKEEQQKCPELKRILANEIRFSPKLELYGGLYCDVVHDTRRIYLPQSMRDEIFLKFHSLAHPGIKAAIRYMTRIYVYPDIKKHITKLTRLCQICAKVKVHVHNTAQIGTYAASTGRFQNSHVDVYGPFPENSGYKYLLTCIDRYTRYPIAVPLKDTCTDTLIEAYLLHVVSHFGPARTLVTDRGAQFTSSKWNDLMQSLKTQHYTTSAYTPKTNSAIERFHRTLNAAIKAHAQANEQIWLPKLPYILLAIRNTIDPDINISPAQAVYGQAIALPGDLLPPYESKNEMTASDFAKKLHKCMQFIPPRVSRPPATKERIDKRLTTCTHVYVRKENRRKMDNHYYGPFRVLERRDTYFKLELPNGPDNVSIDRIKAAWTIDDYLEAPEQPPVDDSDDDIIINQPRVLSNTRVVLTDKSYKQNETEHSSDTVNRDIPAIPETQPNTAEKKTGSKN